MTIQRAQLAEPQRPAFPPLRCLVGHVESILANQAIQAPPIHGGLNRSLNLAFDQDLDVLWGGAAMALSPTSQGFSTATPQVLNLIVEGAFEKAFFSQSPGEMVISQLGEFITGSEITFLCEDDLQLLFDFASGEVITRTDEGEAAESTSNQSESVEMSWLVKNAAELAQYKGEWLLIQGQQLLMHTSDFGAIRSAVRERHIRTPFVYYVPTDQQSNAISI